MLRSAWAYLVCLWTITGKIKDAAQSAMQDAVAQTINVGLNSVLATIPLSMNINDQVGLDYTLVAPPVSANTSNRPKKSIQQ